MIVGAKLWEVREGYIMGLSEASIVFMMRMFTAR